MKKLSELFNSISFKLFVVLSILLIVIFFIIYYVNIYYYADKMEHCIREHAIKSSNLIKQATQISMLKNERDDLAGIMKNLAKVNYIEDIRIYNKQGRIEFSSDSSVLYQTVEKTSEQCIFCHESSKAKGAIPKENMFRKCPTPDGHNQLGLINPIENSKECYSAECHFHSEDERILGLLDFKISLQPLSENKADVRNKSLLFFMLITGITTLVFGRIIRNQIQRPITKLTVGTQQVADLHLDHTIDIDSPDELGKLATSFNKMTEKVRSAQAELKEWSHTLESRVKEKTDELQNAHEQLIMAEKLASMGKLAAIVAHEINNPLSGILTYSKLLIKNLQNNNNPETIQNAIKNLETIRDESKRCGDIVKNLLLFSKKSMGQATQSDLKIILNKSIELVQHSIDMKELELIRNFTSKDTGINCDAAALEQMIVALLINAIEATPSKDGFIKINIERSDARKLFQIEISDNGIGIDKKELPHIFEPFFSTKDNEKSVGLGLAVAYGIVERHNGEINVRSEKGKGTTFTINLPINSNSLG
ncbi:HAMP domain-containing protein [candidate division KSB1 bacterium]|nr:HAMP domain-containing protein [candidate division KSB1 bacterium]